MESYIKILHLGLCPNRGGIETIVHSWWQNIDRDRFHFDFINVYHEPIAFEDEFKEFGSEVYYIPARKENPGKHREELKRIIKEGNYDFVHCHVMSLSEPEPVMICEELGLKTKPIIHSHTVAKLSTMSAKRKLLHFYGYVRLNGHKYLKIACGQEAGKEMFRTKYFTVIENGIDVETYRFSDEKRNEFRKAYAIGKDAFVVGHIGRLDKAKNYPFLIETFAEVKKRRKDALLVLVGDLQGSELISSLLDKYRVKDSCILTGKLSSTSEAYSAFDVFFFPSIYEGISVSMIEAQASGLECVVSENIAHESSVSDFVHFMPISNAQKMADEVVKYADQKNGSRSTREIISEYDIRNSSAKLQKYYQMNTDRRY